MADHLHRRDFFRVSAGVAATMLLPSAAASISPPHRFPWCWWYVPFSVELSNAPNDIFVRAYPNCYAMMLARPNKDGDFDHREAAEALALAVASSGYLHRRCCITGDAKQWYRRNDSKVYVDWEEPFLGADVCLALIPYASNPDEVVHVFKNKFSRFHEAGGMITQGDEDGPCYVNS